MATYHLYRWSIRYSSNPYQAPEQARKTLVGFRDLDTNMIHTSSIISVNGREVTTFSGSVYILEDIDSSYLEWLNDNSIEYNYNNPIKV